MLKINIEDNATKQLEFRDVQIGEVFIVMSSLYLGTRSSASPGVYMKISPSLIDYNCLDLTTMKANRFDKRKQVKLVTSAELNVKI